MPVTASKLKKLLKKSDKLERCGIVLTDGTVIETENLHVDPTQGFHIPGKIMVENEDNLEATWHTHPRDTANLSQSDFAGFNQWPSIKHYIIGVDGVRCFTVADGLVVEE